MDARLRGHDEVEINDFEVFLWNYKNIVGTKVILLKYF